MDTVEISVKGLNENSVTKALRQTKGVVGVDVDLASEMATVTFDETISDADALKRLVTQTHHVDRGSN